MGKNQGGKCRCEGCGALFTALRSFDMHRVGSYAKRNHSRHCLSAVEMRAKGMKQIDNGAWNTGREFPGREKIAS